FAFIYPAMVAASGRNDKEEFSLLLKKMFFQSFSLAIIFAIITILLVDVLLGLISKPIYIDMKYLLYPMLVMMVIQVLSYVPNYALYTQNLDRAIIASNILSSVVFIASVSALAVWNELFAIPVALIFVYIFLLVFKYHSYRRMCRVQ